MKYRVLIADDHPVWRRGLRDILEPTFDIVSEAGEGSEAISQALATRPDVVLMDIGLPGMDGIAAAREIKGSLPDTEVVVITATDSDRDIYEAIQAGVSGFVVKDEKAEVMVEAVQSAAEGKGYLPPQIAKRVLDGFTGGGAGRKGTFARSSIALTGRELVVLRLVAEGRRHKEIASELNISERTVGNHIASIYNKLGICDRSQAIVYAIKHGIVRI